MLGFTARTNRTAGCCPPAGEPVLGRSWADHGNEPVRRRWRLDGARQRLAGARPCRGWRFGGPRDPV
jgi:hypothetical protein